ncbi:MAG TPA: hypothetical protein VD971_11940 [Phycisphaerales bacterium]|nr:hypothetical protein [Phycisphaerales bacterium]
METIIEQAGVVDANLSDLDAHSAKLGDQLNRERESARKRLMNLNAALFAAGVAGLALSIIVALWFRTRKALTAAVGFGFLVAVTLAVSVFAQALAWIGLAVVALSAVALGLWVWIDDRKERRLPKPKVEGASDE